MQRPFFVLRGAFVLAELAAKRLLVLRVEFLRREVVVLATGRGDLDRAQQAGDAPARGPVQVIGDAEQQARAWQERAYAVPAKLIAVDAEEGLYRDSPGVVWQTMPQPVEEDEEE